MPAVLSRLPTLRSLGARLPGSPGPAPRIEGITQRFLQPYPDKPPDFSGPDTEWILVDDLVRRRKFVEGIDFVRQIALTAPGINTKGFNRADVFYPPIGKAGGLGGVYRRGMVHNPISFWTHKSRAKDVFERAALASVGIAVIYIQDTDLYTRPHEIVGLALRGIDLTDRGALVAR